MKRKGDYKKRKREQPKQSAYQLGMKALRVANEVKSLLNVEFKYQQTTAQGQAFDRAGSLGLINQIDQGDDVYERDGDQVRLKRAVVRYSVSVSSTQVGGVCRVLLVLAKQGNVASVSTIMDAALIGTALAPFAHKEYPNRKKFKFLYDKTHDLTNATDDAQICGTINVSLDAVEIFEESSTTITENALYMLFINDQDSGVVTPPIYNFVSRVYYLDN